MLAVFSVACSLFIIHYRRGVSLRKSEEVWGC